VVLLARRAAVPSERSGTRGGTAAVAPAHRTLRLSPRGAARFGHVAPHVARDRGRLGAAPCIGIGIEHSRGGRPAASRRRRRTRRSRRGREGVGAPRRGGGAGRRTCRGDRMSKYVFVTGGVVSSLGKGLASASL